MKLLILKTDITNQKKLNIVRKLFNAYPGIMSWSVDTEDIDNVLRIEAEDHLSEREIIQLVTPAGFQCGHLPD